MKTKLFKMLTAALAVSIITVFVAGCELGGLRGPGITNVTIEPASDLIRRGGEAIPIRVDITGQELTAAVTLRWSTNLAGVQIANPNQTASFGNAPGTRNPDHNTQWANNAIQAVGDGPINQDATITLEISFDGGTTTATRRTFVVGESGGVLHPGHSGNPNEPTTNPEYAGLPIRLILPDGVIGAHRNNTVPFIGFRAEMDMDSWVTPPTNYNNSPEEWNSVRFSIVREEVADNQGRALIDPVTGALLIRGNEPFNQNLLIRAASAHYPNVFVQRHFRVFTPVLTGARAVTGTVVRRGVTNNIVYVEALGQGYPGNVGLYWALSPPGQQRSRMLDATTIEDDTTTAHNLTTRLELQNRGRLNLPADQSGSIVYLEVRPRQALDMSGQQVVHVPVVIAAQPISRAGAFYQVRAGDNHILAIGWDGSLWAWGRNQYGQLGLGNTNNQNRPTRVGQSADWIQVSGGQYHSLAIRYGGQMWAWGFGGRGSLGLGPTSQGQGPEGQVNLGSVIAADPNRPVNVNAPRRIMVPHADGWESVSAGGSRGVSVHYSTVSVAQRTDGRVFTWGTNTFGQSGLNNITTQWVLWPTPRLVTNLTGTWTSVDAGRSSSVAAIRDGHLYTWGSSFWGEGGRGHIIASDQPGAAHHPGRVAAPSGASSWISVSAGYNFMVAVDNIGRLWSWGWDNNGRLGRSATDQNRPHPNLVEFQGESPRFTRHGINISQGAGHVLAICDNDRLWAWGANGSGQLGNGTTTSTSTPFEVLIGGQSRRWRSADAGSNFSIAVALSDDPDEDGLVWTWGNNQFGQMGQGSFGGGNRTTPWRNPHNGR